MTDSFRAVLPCSFLLHEVRRFESGKGFLCFMDAGNARQPSTRNLQFLSFNQIQKFKEITKMRFNNGLERKKFEAKQEALRKEYQKAGMSEEQILAMYEFDLAEFNSNRKYVSHMQPISGANFENDEDSDAETGRNPLFEKFAEALSINFSEEQEHSHFWWVEEIDDPFLILKIKMLSEVDLELLTLLTFDGYSEKQAALILGISDRTVRRKLAAMKLFLKKA